MSALIYRWIGRTVVRVVVRKLRGYAASGTAVKVGIGTTVGVTVVAGLAVAAYVATREVPEA